ncbi:hypothetical protein, partial [Klebsiella pneumoniae]
MHCALYDAGRCRSCQWLGGAGAKQRPDPPPPPHSPRH